MCYGIIILWSQECITFCEKNNLWLKNEANKKVRPFYAGKRECLSITHMLRGSSTEPAVGMNSYISCRLPQSFNLMWCSAARAYVFNLEWWLALTRLIFLQLKRRIRGEMGGVNRFLDALLKDYDSKQETQWPTIPGTVLIAMIARDTSVTGPSFPTGLQRNRQSCSRCKLKTKRVYRSFQDSAGEIQFGYNPTGTPLLRSLCMKASSSFFCQTLKGQRESWSRRKLAHFRTVIQHSSPRFN